MWPSSWKWSIRSASTPPVKAFFGRNRSSSVSERFVLVAMMPMRDWLPNSRLARSTEYAVDGSTGDFDSTPLTDSVAFSREVGGSDGQVFALIVMGIAAAEVARANGAEVALSLSDAFCVERHRDSFQELVDGHVDILFANEMEITSLYKANSFEEAAELVRGRCRIAALTRSELGSVILNGDGTHSIEPFRLGPLVDTTGAGDVFHGAFIYGLLQDWELSRIARFANASAALKCSRFGARRGIPSLEDALR